MQISSLGEFELIARLTAALPARGDVALGVGDDCALLDLGSERLLLATCDSQVEGIHFTFQTSSPKQIGHKALAINLSDIAAMGGEPRYALVSLVLPPQLSVERLDGVYAGLRELAERFHTALVGGNIAGSGSSEQLIIDITLLGTVERGHALTRAGAQPGDVLCVTGALGDSAAGFYTLLHPDQAYPGNDAKMLQAIHQMPRPRVAEGRILSTFGPSIITAMLDVSDGLSGDLGHLCERSQVGARVETARLPLSPALRSLAATVGHDPLDWVLHGGEDYELLFTVTPQQYQAVRAAVQTATGTPVTAIGTMLAPAEGMQLLYPDDRVELLSVKSWDHLRRSS